MLSEKLDKTERKFFLKQFYFNPSTEKSEARKYTTTHQVNCLCFHARRTSLRSIEKDYILKDPILNNFFVDRRNLSD